MTLHTLKDFFGKEHSPLPRILIAGTLLAVLAGSPENSQAQSKLKKNETPEMVSQTLDQQRISRLKKYITLDGKKVDSLRVTSVEGKPNMYSISFDYEFKQKNGTSIGTYPVNLEVSIQDVQNNSFVRFENISVAGVLMANELQIKKINIFDINVTQDVPNQKSFDIRFVYNEQRSLEELDAKILSYDMKSLINISRDAELENTQITGLNNILLSKNIVHEDVKTIYRPIFLWENGKYRELGKVYFDEKGILDKEKTMATMKEFLVLNVPVRLEMDFDQQQFGINQEVIDSLKNTVKLHRANIKRCVENTRIGNPKVFSGLNNIGGVWKQTGLISLSLIDDTYGLQWGKTPSESFSFLFSQDNTINFKDAKGKPTDTYTVQVPDNTTSSLKEVSLVNKGDTRKMIITNENANYLATNTYPSLSGDVPTPLKAAKLIEANPEQGVSYYQEKGEKIAHIPASKNENNQWKIGSLSENVNTHDLLDMTMIKTHTLAAYNITISDIFAAYEELMTNTGIPLKGRKVVKISDGKGGVFYDVVHQDEGSDFILGKDEELYQKAAECNEVLAKNLAILKKISSTELLCKEGGTEYNFHEYIGGQEGIGFHPLAAQDVSTFLKTNPKKGEVRSLSRNFTRGDVNEQDNQVITFFIKDGVISLESKKRLFRKPSQTADMEQKTYKITYNGETGSQLFFEVIPNKK